MHKRSDIVYHVPLCSGTLGHTYRHTVNAYMEIDGFSIFNTPCRICISGASGSGKTCLTHNIIDNKDIIFSQPPTAVLYCYNIHQDIFEEIEAKNSSVKFHQGLPSSDTVDQFGKDRGSKLLVLDDLANVAGRSEDIEQLMTQKSHHLNIYVVYITQNIFDKQKNNRTISLQFDYIFLFRNFRDKGQIACLGRQLYPGYNKAFMDAYDWATKEPFAYLMLNLSARNPHEDIRLLTNIFNEDICIFKLM